MAILIKQTRHIILILLAFSALAPLSHSALAKVDIQFFGDLYVPQRVIRHTKTSEEEPIVFSGVRHLLESSHYNVVNLEGAVSNAFVPFEEKRWLLKMPLIVPKIMAAAHLNVATLANNHSYDFGYQGLFDTLAALREANIEFTGAGRNLEEAARPLILPTKKNRSICILAISRTLPQSFWAAERRAGTAFLTHEQTRDTIKSCASQGHFTIASFHWGEEMSHSPKPYQKELARLAIASGADVVIGHHPHVIQPVEFIDGKPAFYSIGNFAFGTIPKDRDQEGLSIRITLPPAGSAEAPIFEVVELNVASKNNGFIPRPAKEPPPAANAPLAKRMDCSDHKKKKHEKTCLF